MLFSSPVVSIYELRSQIYALLSKAELLSWAATSRSLKDFAARDPSWRFFTLWQLCDSTDDLDFFKEKWETGHRFPEKLAVAVEGSRPVRSLLPFPMTIPLEREGGEVILEQDGTCRFRKKFVSRGFYHEHGGDIEDQTEKFGTFCWSEQPVSELPVGCDDQGHLVSNVVSEQPITITVRFNYKELWCSNEPGRLHSRRVQETMALTSAKSLGECFAETLDQMQARFLFRSTPSFRLLQPAESNPQVVNFACRLPRQLQWLEFRRQSSP